MLHFPRRHIGVEQACVQPAEFLPQVHQFVLVAFVLATQDLPSSAVARAAAMSRCTRARERRIDHQQPRREPRVTVDFTRAGEFSFTTKSNRAALRSTTSKVVVGKGNYNACAPFIFGSAA